MLVFKDSELEDGVEYFCVYGGVVYYLTARFGDKTELDVFYLEGIHGGSDEMFPAFECSLIYRL